MLGHGDGYRYPHDEPGGWVDQEHRPPEVASHRYYEPTGRGDDVPRTPGTGRPAARASDDDGDGEADRR